MPSIGPTCVARDCPVCLESYSSWAQHVRWHPACKTMKVPDEAPEPVQTLSSSEFLVDTSLESLQDEVARDLMDLRFKHGLSEPDIFQVKAACKKWMLEIGTVISQQLMVAGLVQPGATLEQLRRAINVKVFDGLETREQEYAAAKRNLPYTPSRGLSTRTAERTASLSCRSTRRSCTSGA